MALYNNFYLWAIRPLGDTYWKEFSSAGPNYKFGNLLFGVEYQVRVRAYGTVSAAGALKPPRTEDFREIDAWERALGYSHDYPLSSGPTIHSPVTGWDRQGAWVYIQCTASLYATNWSVIFSVTTVAEPKPSQVTGLAVTDEPLYVDPTTGITLASVKVEWDNNPADELVDIYEILRYA